MDDIVTLKAQRRAPPVRPSREAAEAAVRTLIAWAGDDPAREGLVDTPRRVVKAYEELFAGYGEDAGLALSRVFEEVEGYQDIVLVRDIPFVSHCEHHMAPFFGKAHIGYYPSHGVVGLSKLARIVDTFARRLHTCMSMRGVKKHGISTVTTQFSGVFRARPEEQVRFLALLRGAR